MASMTVPTLDPQPGQVTHVVVGGIDTHKDLHVAAVVDGAGAVLGTESFSTTRAGYRALLRWMRSFGDLRRVGVEGTGSYGAGLTRHLAEADVEVLEVDRPDRTERRRRGKSDTFDAICAAQVALAGRRTSIPKSRNGMVESLRVLKLTRATAIRARTKALQLLRLDTQGSIAGSQYTSICLTERRVEAGAKPSIGSVGDSYDNAMAESIIGLFKTEVIRCQGPWRNRDAVEMATLEWVDWYNNRRLFEALGDIPPAKAESAYYATMTRPRALEWQNKPSTELGAVQLGA